MSQNKAINAASFREWFNQNLTEETRLQVHKHGATPQLFHDYGGESALYDRFTEEVWEIVMQGESSLTSALGNDDLGCLAWLRSAMVFKASDKLATERYGGSSAPAGSGAVALL
jgi:hypothetical protein